jgi:hypothetical protein
MAFIVPTKRGTFEIRESRSTPKGPRSRTLASFEELTDEVIAKARDRASTELDAEELRGAARRVGATVAPKPADRAARDLAAELGRGKCLDPKLRRVLVDLLAEEGRPRSASDASHSVAEWMAATPDGRGRALIDLLELVDALPLSGRLGKPLEYPPLLPQAQ